ncbi:hypothetical protein [Methanocella conradii]|nr:hypothetical protein [Methanocella conradii]MDI6896821.1 hypothetical protein [Methanocella conradii]
MIYYICRLSIQYFKNRDVKLPDESVINRSPGLIRHNQRIENYRRMGWTR